MLNTIDIDTPWEPLIWLRHVQGEIGVAQAETFGRAAEVITSSARLYERILQGVTNNC